MPIQGVTQHDWCRGLLDKENGHGARPRGHFGGLLAYRALQRLSSSLERGARTTAAPAPSSSRSRRIAIGARRREISAPEKRSQMEEGANDTHRAKKEPMCSFEAEYTSKGVAHDREKKKKCRRHDEQGRGVS